MKKYFLTILVYLILAVLTIIFIRNNYGDFASIPEISVFYFSLMILVSFISLFVNGLRIKLFGDYYNINLKKKEWFGLAAVTTMDNYLTPFRGGVAVRALYLRKVYNFPFKSFLTTIVASYTIRILIYSLFGIILSIISLTYYEIFNLWVFILFIGLFLISLIIVLFSPTFSIRKNKFLNWIIHILNDWRSISKNYKFLIKLGLIEFLFVSFMGIRLFFSYKAFNLSVPLLVVLIIAILSTLSVFLAVTPAGLGVTELVITLSSAFVGLQLTEGGSVALLDRLSSVIIAFSFGTIFNYILMKDHQFSFIK